MTSPQGLVARMQAAGIGEWGVCRLEELELLPVRSRGRIPVGAKSVITMLFGYYAGEYPGRNVARYALADDYHQLVGGLLSGMAEALERDYVGEVFVPFVDASPIPEVRAAALAGLGRQGRNGLLLNPAYGSYCFIGELVTTLALPAGLESETELCTGCGACVTACPTGALRGAGFCVERCRSQVTQKKGALTDWEAAQIRAGGLVWGCDSCTDSCPVNKRLAKEGLALFQRDIDPVMGEDNLVELCARKAYGWRGADLLQRNLRLLEKP